MAFSRIPRLAVGATVAGVAAIAIGVGALAAEGRFQPAAVSSPAASSDKAKAEAYCNKFLSHLATNLGKSQTEVTGAIGKAVTQTIDDAVASGDLTKAQADRLKAKLASGPVCRGRFGGAFGFREKGRAELPAVLDAAAKSLNLTTAELKADLAKGETLHQIADSKGITEAQFRAALITNLTPVLDQAVTQGKLTKTQETEILQRLQTGPIPFWDASMKRHRVPSATPSPTPGV
jgi:uncharacterized protein YidB (DUF937 family)